MSTRLVVTVVTSSGDLILHGPGGFRYVDEVFDEAGLRESTDVSEAEAFQQRLRVLQRALRREFGSRVGMRVISPWTLNGMVFVVRHRLRDFPCLVIGGQRYSLEATVDEVVEAVRLALAL